MNIEYATDGIGNLEVLDGVLIFTASKGTEIQSGEIKKVSTGIILQVPEGCVIQVTTHPSLIEKAIQLFPACTSLTPNLPEDYLMLPIHNVGRNTFHVRPGDALARGFVSPIENIDKHLYEPQIPTKVSRSTRPQKKNSDIKFEVS